MSLSNQQLSEKLKNGLARLYMLHGDEPLLEQEALDQIRVCARSRGFSERNSFVASATQFDWSAVLAASSSQSLFAERIMLEIRLPGGKPGKEGAAILQQLAQQAAAHPKDDTSLLVLMLPRADRTMQQTPWFAALQRVAEVVRIDPVSRRDMPGWLAQRLKAQGQSVEAGEAGMRTLAFFTDCVEGNLMAAHQEVQKLSLIYPPGPLSRAQIEASVLNVARFAIADLSEAVLTGRPGRAQRIFEGLLAEGEATVRLHSVLAGDILSWYRARQALDEGLPLPQALRQARVWGPREKLLEALLPRTRPGQLSRLLHSAHIVDGICKGLKAPDWPQDARGALQRLMMQLARTCQHTLGNRQA